MKKKQVKLVGEVDANVWAKEFVRLHKHNIQYPLDEETMRGWFANAIMAGHDEEHRRLKERVKEIVPEERITNLAVIRIETKEQKDFAALVWNAYRQEILDKIEAL